MGAKSELSEALREAKTKNVTLEEKVAKLEGELAEMSAKLAASEADREKRSISEEVILRAKTVEEELGQTQWQLVQVCMRSRKKHYYLERNLKCNIFPGS